MRPSTTALLALVLASSSLLQLPAATAAAAPVAAPAALPAAASTALEGWVVRAEDNIVGLSDPKTLSSPGQVDYSALMKATPEMKRMKKDRIDPNSPEGIQLKAAAQTRVQDACQAVMDSEGHCSVWKAISHSDGRAITDITSLVKRQL